MGLLPDTTNCRLRMRRECRERFPRHRLRGKTLVRDPDMHHGTIVTHVPWCMSGSLNCGGGENVPGIPVTCATRNFTYLARSPWWHLLAKVIYILDILWLVMGLVNNRRHLRLFPGRNNQYFPWIGWLPKGFGVICPTIFVRLVGKPTNPQLRDMLVNHKFLCRVIVCMVITYNLWSPSAMFIDH